MIYALKFTTDCRPAPMRTGSVWLSGAGSALGGSALGSHAVMPWGCKTFGRCTPCPIHSAREASGVTGKVGGVPSSCALARV